MTLQMPAQSTRTDAAASFSCARDGAVWALWPSLGVATAETCSPAAKLVERIIDVDVGADEAGAMCLHVLPSTTPFIIFQYRVHIGSIRQFAGEAVDHGQYGAVATSVQSGIVTVRPYGPVGVVLVRLRPGAAALILGEELASLADAKVDLQALFGRSSIAVLEERLSEAGCGIERIRLVSDFIGSSAREHRTDAIVTEAVRSLRLDPNMRIRRLAADLDVSERHLTRLFRNHVGSTPKLFARLARFERVMTARSRGLAWADLSYAAGFVDQAHMINDVGDILGSPPEQAFRLLATEKTERGPVSLIW